MGLGRDPGSGNHGVLIKRHHREWDPSCKVFIGGLRDAPTRCRFDIEFHFSDVGKVNWRLLHPLPGLLWSRSRMFGCQRDRQDLPMSRWSLRSKETLTPDTWLEKCICLDTDTITG